jgi:hypothetical protein
MEALAEVCPGLYIYCGWWVGFVMELAPICMFVREDWSFRIDSDLFRNELISSFIKEVGLAAGCPRGLPPYPP